MAETVRLSPDGPHDYDYTSEVAIALSEVIRVLNHATLSCAGITYPSTVYDVLSRIGNATAGLDQLLAQLGEALRRMLESGQLVTITATQPTALTLRLMPYSTSSVSTPGRRPTTRSAHGTTITAPSP
ncbi:hypothetical protein ACGFNP_60055 [Nonomuraea sp. NPDC049269]|uniref:hypothetical protein n=1 Tax=Nonomuraea sp. NPDC049269 TaxID=3364349 RepID=UPI003717BC9B